MHVQCCDITYDVTVPFNDVTLENKMMRHVQNVPTQNCLKMAIEQEHHGHGTPRALGVPCNATPSPAYLGVSLRPEPTTALFIIISTMSFVTNQAKIYKL